MSFISLVTPLVDQCSLKGQDCLQLIDTTFYLFVVEWTLADSSNPVIRVVKSTDDGVTWTHVVYGPNVRDSSDATFEHSAQDGIACVKEDSNIRVFYCSSTGSSSETGFTGLLSTVLFNTSTETFGIPVVSDFNPFPYRNTGSGFTLTDVDTSGAPIYARRTSSGIYRIIMSSEYHDVTTVGGLALTSFSGTFSSTKVPVLRSVPESQTIFSALIDPSTNVISCLFWTSTIGPFYGRLNLDGSVDQLQVLTYGQLEQIIKFAYIDANKFYFNWMYRPSYPDYASILSGPSNIDPTTLTQLDVDAAFPTGNTYTYGPTAIFSNGGTCYCAFFFAKKVGSTDIHLMRTFKVGAFWSQYVIVATFSSGSFSTSPSLINYNWAGLYPGGDKFSLAAGGMELRISSGTPAAMPVYFARGDITFHPACLSIVSLSVTVSDSMSMSDLSSSNPAIFLSTEGSGTPVHSCPDVIVSSAFCSDIKTPNDGEISLHDCEERLYTENTQPCIETLV